MARGWESKSVEEQQSEASQPSTQGKPTNNPESRQRANTVQALRLKRARVVEQLRASQNARFIELMQQELAYLDTELAKLTRS